MSNIKLSVCIPVYNGEKFIIETINSVLNQTYEYFELLVIDNNSTDKTIELVQKIKDKRLRIIKNKTNVGMAGNFNRCLELAKGDYIQILCADDLLEKNCLLEKVQFIKSHKENLVIITNNTSIINDKGETIFVRKNHKKNTIVPGYKFARKSIFRGNIYGEPTNILINRNVIKKTSLFDLRYSYYVDWEYWLRISAFGYIGCINKTLTKFRTSLDATSTAFSKQKDRLNRENKMFCQSLIDIKYLNVNKFDLFIHKMVMKVRNILRNIFIKFNNAKG